LLGSYSDVGYTHCVSKKDSDVADYNFIGHQLILAIFSRYVVDKVCYQMMICYPTGPN